MFCKTCVTTLCLAAVAAVGIAAGFGQPGKDHKSPTPSSPAAGGGHAQPGGEMKLPPGMTKEDMQACIEAGTPGEMHAWLARSAGTWKGKQTMWMAPGAPPATSEVTSTSTVIMDGRYIKCEITGDMMGMPFSGMALNGYDNVTRKFVGTWIDNQSTGIMTGTGELSSDKKTLTWNFAFTNPMTKKADTMREVDTFTGDNAFTMEMFGNDHKTGKEYKMIRIEFTRQK